MGWMIDGYMPHEMLGTRRFTTIHRAIRSETTKTFIIKALSATYPEPEQLARMRREFSITSGLDHPAIIKAYALVPMGNGLAMVMEDMGGVDLGRVIADGPSAISTIRAVALALVDAVEHLHRHDILHKDINPTNILWNKDTRALRLIDFGIASQLSRERPGLAAVGELEGTVRYMAPEQTGRMNRSIDYRSDFYALGATLYHLTCGEPPFDGETSLEIVHGHLARQARQPSVVSPGVPALLSAIIMKLLEKDPNDRYQSAEGLRSDLERLQEVDDGGHEQPDAGTIEVGRDDVSDRFGVPDTLFGRDRAIDHLVSVLDRVGTGPAEMVVVEGYSGVGKSALIAEIHAPLAIRGGVLISGKFDQYRRDIPYSAIMEALRDLVRRTLTEPDAAIEALRRRLDIVLAGRGRIILDLISEAAPLLGPQPDLPDMPPTEETKRFNETLAAFIRAFCIPEHPVLMVLDDLQWADGPSLRWIQHLAEDTERTALMIVGAYRENEVPPSHPLALTLCEIAKVRSIERINLDPLDLGDTTSMVAATVLRRDEAVRELAALVHRKTEGNPFYVRRLLTAAHEVGLLTFDTGSRAWVWDAQAIAAMPASDNVIELMVGLLRRQPLETQGLLRVASCIGTTFDGSLLARVMGSSVPQVAAALMTAAARDLIVPIDPAMRDIPWSTEEDGERDFAGVAFRFFHDRVQEAAYQELSPEDRASMHHAIGMVLLDASWAADASTKGEETAGAKDASFEVADHLNRAIDLVTAPGDRRRLAHLNLAAARRARASTAFAAALTYVDQGLVLIGEDGWRNDLSTAFDLTFLRIECCFLLGHLDDAEACFGEIATQSLGTLETLRLHELMMRVALTSHRFEEGLGLARDALALYGIPFPFDDAEAMNDLTEDALGKVEEAFKAHSTDSVLDLADHGDDSLAYCFAILMRAWTLCFLDGNVGAMGFTGLKIVQLTLRHGIDRYSSCGFMVLATIESGQFGHYARAYDLGTLAMALNERTGNVAAIPPTNNLFGHVVSHYTMPYRDIPPVFRESYDASLRCGEVEWGVWAASFLYLCPFIAGAPLGDVDKEIDRFTAFIDGSGSDSMRRMARFQKSLLHALMGSTDGIDVLERGDFDEAELVSWLDQSEFGYCQLWYHLYRSYLSLLAGDAPVALRHGRLAEEKILFAPAFMKYAEHHFHFPLVLAVSMGGMEEEERSEAILTMVRYRDQLDLWAKACPDNYRHKHLMVAGVCAWAQGDMENAINALDAAIAAAKEQGFQQDAALANELSARLMLDLGRDRASVGYLMEARYWYQRWGALAKVAALEEAFPYLANEATTVQATGTSGTKSLDIDAVLIASRALSAEVSFQGVLKTLMRIARDSAGARIARLVLLGADAWRLEATLSDDVIDVNSSRVVSMDAESDEALPLTIFRYMVRLARAAGLVDRTIADRRARSRPEAENRDPIEPIVISDLSKDHAFGADPYVERHQTRSVMCLPLLTHKRLVGILYLENNLASGVFVPARVRLLGLISAQIAISLENAQLYADLEERVEQRTRELNDALDRQRALNAELNAKTVELDAANVQLRALADKDGLTGLANRRTFDARLLAEVIRCRREDQNLSLVMLDADHFKALNDTHGHIRGDACLKVMATVLADTSRDGIDLAARYGGEEFALILPGYDLDAARSIAETLRARIKGQEIPHDGHPFSNVVTVSLGVASLVPGDADPAALIERADMALYSAKSGGRDRVAVAM